MLEHGVLGVTFLLRGSIFFICWVYHRSKYTLLNLYFLLIYTNMHTHANYNIVLKLFHTF